MTLRLKRDWLPVLGIAAGGNDVEYVQAEGIQRTRYGRNNIVDVAVRADSGLHLAEARIFGVAIKPAREG